MPSCYKNIDDLKRKLRALKKFEMKIRFENRKNIKKGKGNSYSYSGNDNMELVWNSFFDLKDSAKTNAKYNIKTLSAMTKDEIKNAINEYLCHLFYCFCRENGDSYDLLTDLDLLTALGLPSYSDYEDVIKKFKELIKTYHPDNGGDAEKFLEIMKKYKNFKWCQSKQ